LRDYGVIVTEDGVTIDAIATDQERAPRMGLAKEISRVSEVSVV